MDLTQLLTRLEQIGGDAAAAREFGQGLAGWLRYPAQMGVERLATGEPEQEVKRMVLLDTMPTVALPVAAGSLGTGRVVAEAWKVRMLTDELGRMRGEAARTMVPLLRRRGAAPEEAGMAGARACDVAYLMLNRWLRRAGVAGYMGLMPKERDAAIEELEASDAFLELL